MPPSQITEVGYGGNALTLPPQLTGPVIEDVAIAMEQDPGSALAYGGSDGENSVDVLPAFDLSGVDTSAKSAKQNITLDQLVRQGDEQLTRDMLDQPCGLTLAEWEAHKAQMIADQEQAQKDKLMHLALAALAGYLISRFMR